MALTPEDIEAIAALVEQKLEPRFSRIDDRFGEVQEPFEGLYAANEKREQEYVILTGQMSRLESKVDDNTVRLDRLESKVDDNTVRLDRLDAKVDRIEGKLDQTIERVDAVEKMVA